MQRVPFYLALVTLLFSLSACGSGVAAIGSAIESDPPPALEPFVLSPGTGTPALSVAESEAAVGQAIATAQLEQNLVPSLRLLTLPISRSPNIATLDVADFDVAAWDVDSGRGPEIPVASLTAGNGVLFVELARALHLNKLYSVTLAGQIEDIDGQALSGPYSAYAQVGEGALDAQEEFITFGSVAAGGLQLGGANRGFVGLETAIGNTFFITTGADSDFGTYSTRLLYQNNGQSFNQLNTSGVQLNGTVALIRAQEGRLNQVHNGVPEDSVRVRAFPGMILQPGAEITWPNLVNGSQSPDRYVIDRGSEFAVQGTGNTKHIAWRPRVHPLSVQQAQNSLGKNVVVWWAWQDENVDTFEDYGVYANSIDLDLGFQNEWSDPVRLSDPNDGTVGWPKSTAFDSGAVVAIWHDAATQEELYLSAISRYQAARFDAQTNSWGPASTYELGGDLGRIGDVESLPDGEFLVFARQDEDGDFTVGNSGSPERASISVRRLGFDTNGDLASGLGGSNPVMAPNSPDPDLYYSVQLGYESALPSGGGVPQESGYSQVRNGIDRFIPSAMPIDGQNFLVSWEDTSPSGAQRLWLAVFDAVNMVWRNGEAIDIVEQLELNALASESSIIGITVDRLGFANVAWREGPASRHLAVRVVRTTTSILGPGPTPVRDAFPVGSGEAQEVARFVSNNPDDPDDQTAGGIYPAFSSLSNVDRSGHVAFFWGRLYLETASSGAVLIGTNARRFR